MIYVAIIDDEPFFCDTVKSLLNKSGDFECVACYPDCETALQHLSEAGPDVVLLDVEIPDKMSGIDALLRIKEQLPEVDVIMLTVHDDSDTVFKSLRNGASGYLIKNINPDDLLHAITEARQGGAPMSMQIARTVINFFKERPPLKPLSERQKQILQLLIQGKSSKVIARELYITKATIKFHCKNIYQALQARNRVDAVRVALTGKI